MRPLVMVIGIAFLAMGIGLFPSLMQVAPPDATSTRIYSKECERMCMGAWTVPYSTTFRPTSTAVSTGVSLEMHANGIGDGDIAFRIAYRFLDGGANVSWGWEGVTLSQVYLQWYTFPARTTSNLSSTKNYVIEVWALRTPTGAEAKWEFDRLLDDKLALVVWGDTRATPNYYPEGGDNSTPSGGSTGPCDPETEHVENGVCVQNEGAVDLGWWLLVALVILLVALGAVMVLMGIFG